jgi:hypothetical protein
MTTREEWKEEEKGRQQGNKGFRLMMAATEGYKATREEGQQQRRTYVPAVASMGRLAESSSWGQSANMMLSPL